MPLLAERFITVGSAARSASPANRSVAAKRPFTACVTMHRTEAPVPSECTELYRSLVAYLLVERCMNHIRWHQPLPNWARMACIIFGIANIGGAIAQWSDLTFPGIVVGGVWAVFGWKGIPLIPSVSGASPPQKNDIVAGRSAIRGRRLWAFVVPFAWLLLAAIAMPRVPKQFMATAFFLSAMPIFFLIFRCFFSACPRCSRHFFLDDRLLRTSLTRCVHCGLSLRGRGSVDL